MFYSCSDDPKIRNSSVSRGLSIILPLTVLIFLVAGCTPQDATQKEKRNISKEFKQEFKEEQDTDFENFTATGDLLEIQKRGVIRFVNLATNDNDLLPRSLIVTQRNFQLAEALAKALDLDARWISAPSPEKALQMLNSGRADVLAGTLTRTEEREKNFSLSEPLRKSRQQLVTGLDGPDVSNPQKLGNVEISVLKDSTYEKTAKRLQEINPGIQIKSRELQNEDTIDQLLDNINQETNRITILDTAVIEGLLSYRDDLKIGAMVSEDEDIVWAMRKDSPDLKLRINNFLTKHIVSAPVNRNPDWPSIEKSGVIRFLTYNGATSYFMWKGVLMGFDFDLAKRFADEHSLALQLIVVPHNESLIDWLKSGRGDFAGASTTITPKRQSEGVDFTASYVDVPQQIISNRRAPKINHIRDLNGRTLVLRANSAFLQTAEALKNNGINVKIIIADPNISSERIVNMVADGSVDATIVDANTAKIGAALRDELVVGPKVTEPLPQGWMVIHGNQSLRRKLDHFIREFKDSKSYVRKVDTYYKPNANYNKKLVEHIRPGGDLSPFDEIVKKTAREYEFDWRLIVAQMWQESSFNPKAVSPVGAQGLLQVMPRTAEEMGYPHPLFEPGRAISAGIKYLDWVRGKFEKNTLETKLWFSLASYNAGIGHLYDARRLAKQLDLDPDIWFGNVEVAMLKLSEPRYFTKARYGYVRGAEPVQYVRNIRQLYLAYTNIKPGDIVNWSPGDNQNRELVSRRASVPLCRYGYWSPPSDVYLLSLPTNIQRLSIEVFCPQKSAASH